MSALRQAVDSSGSLTADEREAIHREVEKARSNEPPPVIVVVGESGVGKSSTLNALFNAGQQTGAVSATTLAAEGMYVEATTQSSSGDAPRKELLQGSKGLLQIFDMPGLGDDMRNYDAYRELYAEVFPKADVILWVHPVYDRAVEYIQQALHDFFVEEFPRLKNRLVFGLNKADSIEPNNWNVPANVPSSQQLQYLNERQEVFRESIEYVLPRWKGSVETYSAARRYQLPRLFKSMMRAMPDRRRWVLEERMDLADFTEFVDRGILRVAQERTSLAPPPRREPPQGVGSGRASRRDERPLSAEELIARMSPSEYAALVNDRPRFLDFLRQNGG